MIERFVNFRRALALGLLCAFGSGHASECQNNIPPSNPDSAYIFHADGTVTDARSGLMWKRCAEGQDWDGSTCTGTESTHAWAAALQLAQDSTYAGYSDWRLPDLKELRSLVEECRVAPAINVTIFPNASSSHFWSGSPVAGHSDDAWGVYFYYGDASGNLRSNAGRVRLVRVGQ